MSKKNELALVLREIYEGMVAAKRVNKDYTLSPTAITFVVGVFDSYDRLTGILSGELSEEEEK